MTRILTTIHLSDIQKEVLAKVKAAQSPQMAWETIQRSSANIDNNFAAARDVLGNLGLLKVGEDEIEVTDKGLEVMNDENLTDEMGEMTDEGRQLADIDRSEKPAPAGQQQQAAPLEEDMGMGDEGMEDMDLGLESFNLLKSINEDANNMHLFESSRSQVTPEIMNQVLQDTVAFLRDDKEWYDLAQVSQNVLYDAFSHEMPYGTQTGDDDTPDNWIWELGDREGVEAVVGEVKRYLENKASRREEIWLR